MEKIFLLFGLLLMYGCILDYNATGIDEAEGMLVVEGLITNDTTAIVLSKSIGLTEKLSYSVYIDNATLYVDCSDGNYFQVTKYVGNGKYLIPTGNLNPDLAYRLKITHEGNEYQSEYLSPFTTPAIDSISWKKEAGRHPVYICLSTHDPQNQYNYYLWSYEEVWETHPELVAYHYEVGNEVFEYDVHSSSGNNIYYCWKYDHSKILLLGSTEKQHQSIIEEREIKVVEPSNDRFQSLYYIKVKQNAIRQEAFAYFSNLQKNIEQTGSIFSPIPSETKGNIICVTQPNIPVIGYIDVSTTTEKDRYIPNIVYEPTTNQDCSEETWSMVKKTDYILFQLQYGVRIYAPQKCVDCKYNGGSKKRPVFWPNNNY